MNLVGRTVGLVGLVAVIATAIVGTAAPATAAAPAAAPTTVSSAVVAKAQTTIGLDISYPQCTATKSNNVLIGRPFAVIGVNGGKASTINPCFSREYNAALLLDGTTEQPHAAPYLNTGNPGRLAGWWPKENKTQGLQGSDIVAVTNPKGTCNYKSGPACAYVYGYSMAEADFYFLTQGGNTVANEPHFAVPPLWWLDVETSNSWSATDTKANTASLEGMMAYLEAQGVKVGIYSTSYQFGRIAGPVASTSALAGHQSWLAGASSSSAPGDCENLPALTPGGRVSLVQYVLGTGTTALDNDYSCHAFSAPTPTITGTLTVGQTLIASHGTWSTGTVSFKYQWYRNGVAASGATKSTHKLSSSDTGKKITVKISGRESGYNPLSKTSASTTAVLKAFTTTPTPKFTGTKTVGKTLTASPGTWKPGTVAKSYQWLRDGVAIDTATARTYLLQAADAGTEISLRVTGTESGYAPVTKTSAQSKITAAP